MALAAYVASHPALSVALYLALFTAVVTACLPGPGVLSVAGGFLFGTLAGGAAALGACTAGSVLVFLACRLAFGDWLARRAGKRIARLEAALSRHPFLSLLSLRLLPFFPYFVATLAAGLSRVRSRDLVAATAVGSAPVSFILAGLGAGLGRAFDRGVRIEASILESPRILVPLAALAVLSAAPLAWRLYRARRLSVG
ncbi:MAG: TVP38/TMEM64 family protein [Caulobacteraceae bacterium]